MALLYALWTVSLVALLVAGFQDVALTRAMTARTALAQAEAMALSDGALALGLMGLIGADPVTIRPGRFSVTVAGVEVAMSLEDEGGKIDLNHAPPDLLAALGAVAGAPGFAAAVLAARDAAGLVAAPGAAGVVAAPGAAGVVAAPGAAGPSRPAFTLPEEIARLPALTDAARLRLLPSLTTLSRSETVDAAVAGPLALRAATGATEAEADRFIASRRGRLARYPATQGFQGPVLGAGYTLRARAERGTAVAGRTLLLRPLPLGARRGLALVEARDLAAEAP